jgi:hypothetical protein
MDGIPRMVASMQGQSCEGRRYRRKENMLQMAVAGQK